MSDIFISYARADRLMAEALANDLKAQGYRVWWDAELVGSDDFYEVILQALHDAKAAIVIWSKNSAKSNFVRDEARFALHLKKLIAVKETGLDPFAIPFGFQGQHTDDVTDREQIMRAVEKLGVMRVAVAPTLPTNVEKLQTSGGVREIAEFLGTDPPAAERYAVLARVAKLAQSPETAKGVSPAVQAWIQTSKTVAASVLQVCAVAFGLLILGVIGEEVGEFAYPLATPKDKVNFYPHYIFRGSYSLICSMGLYWCATQLSRQRWLSLVFGLSACLVLAGTASNLCYVFLAEPITMDGSRIGQIWAPGGPDKQLTANLVVLILSSTVWIWRWTRYRA